MLFALFGSRFVIADVLMKAADRHYEQTMTEKGEKYCLICWLLLCSYDYSILMFLTFFFSDPLPFSKLRSVVFLEHIF